MRLSIAWPVRPQRRTVHTSLVADLFGLNDEAPTHVVAQDFELPLTSGQIVAFTGPSGSGKSSLLRAAVHELTQAGDRVVRPDELDLPDAAVIDGLGLEFPQAAALLSSCGLAEPRLMLRRPVELSDGERWRFRLAAALASSPRWVAADEFTAAVDRTLAKVIAFNVRRACDRTGVGFLIATCHDDVIADLAPDLHVVCDHDGAITLTTTCSRNADSAPSPLTNHHSPAVHRPCSASPATSSLRPVRHATGRISLGGITGLIASAESGS